MYKIDGTEEMMKFSGYELLWLFFVYSFLGWIGETVYATIRQKKFANRGLINGPLCIIYGVGAVVISVTINELNGIWLFIFSMIYLTVIEWIAGHLIEKVYKERWWDYRECKWNLDGYICLFSSVLWGILGFLVIKFGNGLALLVFKLCPSFIIELIIWIFAAVLAVDILASYMLVTGRKGRFDKLERANNAIANATAKLGKWIALHVEKRITKAYPQMEKSAGAEKEAGFAKGCSFYKIILLFFIGAFLGDVTETIFCRLTAGVWMSRSSGSASSRVPAVIKTPSAAQSHTPFQKYCLNPFGSCAPTDWASGMPNPMQAPCTKPSVTKFSE